MRLCKEQNNSMFSEFFMRVVSFSPTLLLSHGNLPAFAMVDAKHFSWATN